MFIVLLVNSSALNLLRYLNEELPTAFALWAGVDGNVDALRSSSDHAYTYTNLEYLYPCVTTQSHS